MSGGKDSALLDAWRAGDTAAGEVLVKRHFESLFRVFEYYGGDATADLIQSTWTACVAQRERIPVGVSFRAFVFGIARKQLYMMLRKRYRGQKALRRVAAAATEATSPSQAAARKERAQHLQHALASLSPDTRLLIQLVYWEQLPLKEVAVVFEVPTGTIKSRLHSARAELRATLHSSGLNAALINTTLAELDNKHRG